MRKQTLTTLLTYTAIFSSIATCIATIIAIISFIASNKQATKAYEATVQQIELQTEPNVEIFPSNMILGKAGKFNLSLINRGPSRVVDIGITQNHFVGYWKTSEPISITTDFLQTMPSLQKPKLLKDSIFYFDVNVNNLIDFGKKMKDEKNCKYINLLKLQITYYREVDHKEFNKYKVFLLSEGDCLWDFNDENFVKFGGTSFNEIKRLILK